MPLGFYFKQTGSASEVYVDGRRVGEFGIVGKDLKSEKAMFNLASRPFPVVFTNPGTHLIALRYSSIHSRLLAGNENRLSRGFSIKFKDLNTEFEDLTNTGKYFPIIFLFAVFITLGLVHMIMFFYFKNDKPNLFWIVLHWYFVNNLFGVLYFV